MAKLDFDHNNKNLSMRGVTFPGYKERYPKGVNLHPDGESHTKLLQFLLRLVNASYNEMHKRHSQWQEVDRKQTAFFDLTEGKFDKTKTDREIQRENPGKPVSIVLPQSRATKEVMLTYYTAAFLQSPIFRYQPSADPNDTLGVLLLESLVEAQAVRQKMAINLHTLWSDDLSYGFGAVAPIWIKEKGFRTRKGQQVERVKYEGSALISIDPYNALPDPSVPITDTKRTRWWGWLDRTDYMSLLDLEKQDDTLFNVRYLGRAETGKSKFYSGGNTGRHDKTSFSADINDPVTAFNNTCDVIWLYVKLIPKQFKLSSYDYPEIWRFGIVGDRFIISASPLRADLNQIPVCTAASKWDGHSLVVPSSMEVSYPIQHAIDWLWGSRISNLRKAINNMLLVDPSLVNINDVLDTSAGMVARMRAAAWGRGQLNDAMKQFEVKDVTSGHINDILFLVGLDDRFSGVGDQMRGIQPRTGERVSSAEARFSASAGVSRREKDAKFMGIQAHYDIALWLASNTLQYSSEEMYVKILGQYEDVLQQEYGDAVTRDAVGNLFVKTDLSELDVDFDVIVQDGTVPTGEYADVWERLMSNAAAHPEIYQRLDFVRIWLHVARLLGAKNPQDFLKPMNMQMQVVPDQVAAAQEQSGNFVPLEGLQNIPQG